jgi:hypothetical protein
MQIYVIDLVNVTTDQNYFKYYQLVLSAEKWPLMCLPVSGIFAQIFLQELEQMLHSNI